MYALLVAAAGCGPDYKLDEAAKRIEVTPALVDLGTLAVGASASTELTLTSITGGQVDLIAADVFAIEGAGFLVEGELPSVPSGETATLSVSFAPTLAGYHLAQLTLVTDEGSDNEHVVDLRGAAAEGSAQVWPLVLDFGPVAVGAEGAGEVTVYNDGEVDVTIEDAAVTGAAFALDTPLPLTVAPDATATLDLRFSPYDAEPAEGALALGGGLSVITLRGNACATGTPALYDADTDGWTACAGDCEDGDPSAHPGGTEVCDGVDQDCDGLTDDGTDCYDDDDDGVSEAEGDCNDGDASVSSAAAEDYGNGVDDDCDGTIDYGTEDGDGDGYAWEGGDCDTADPSVYPGAPELADGQDNDCDGTTDEGTSVYDDDGDGVSESAGDCDDSDATAYPGAPETADGTDDDCDGDVDEGTSSGDDDGDGYTETGGDCDDADATINPGEPETSGDSTDNNCDGTVE